VLDGNWESNLFILELGLSAIIPILLFAVPRARASLPGLTIGAACVVLGFVLHRLSVGGIATVTATGSIYVPSWMEVTISAGVVSAAALAFLFFVEHFKVYEEEAIKPEAVLELPEPDPVSETRLAAPWAPAWQQYSFAFIVAACMVFALLPDDIMAGAQPKPMPVDVPRTVYALKTPAEQGLVARYALIDSARDSVPAGSEMTDVLLLDGDRNGKMVFFPHEAHKARNGGEQSCKLCHHMNKPLDRATPCFNCHRDMFNTVDTFDHDFHAEKMGGNDNCTECHQSMADVKSRQTATPCLDCHQEMVVDGSFIKSSESPVLDWAPGYMDAMHGLCIKCHEDILKQDPQKDPGFARCEACHQEMDPEKIKKIVLQAREEKADADAGHAVQKMSESE